MDDMIYRQAAIDAIETWGLIDGLSEGQAIEILADEEKVPSVQQAHSEGLYVDGYNNGYRDGIKDAQTEGELDQAGSRMGQAGSSDLISRRAAIGAINCDITVRGRQNAELVAATIGTFADRIKALPSAQPEIIRCKDCIKREVCRTSTVWAVAPNDNWYCADAERRTDGVDR